MPDSFRNKLNMLQAIPRYSTYWTAEEIKRKAGVACTDKHAREMLKYFESIPDFGVVRMPGGGPNPDKWAVKQQVTPPLFKMEAVTALTLQMASEMLDPLLSQSIRGELEPYFKSAEEVLKKAGYSLGSGHDADLRDFSDKVLFLPKDWSRLPPKIDSQTLNDIYMALLGDRKLRVVYRADLKDPEEMVLNPVGLLCRPPDFFLAATKDGLDGNSAIGVQRYKLDRFDTVEILDESAKVSPRDREQFLAIRSKRLNIDDHPFKNTGGFGKDVLLRLLARPGTVQYMVDRPFSADQEIKEQDDGRYLVEAKVKLGRNLLKDLVNFSVNKDVEVIGPPEVIDYLHDYAVDLAEMYLLKRSR